MAKVISSESIIKGIAKAELITERDFASEKQIE